MQLRVKGRGVEVSDAIRSYAEKRLGKLERQLPDPRIELELSEEHNPSIRNHHVAEATVWTKGPVLRAKESSNDMRASIDQLVDKLERQITRYRGKRKDRRHGRGAQPPPDGGIPMDTDDPQIVRTKQFAVKPMTAEEAVLQLELVGHDFFVFRNADSDAINVLYRRDKGGYGLIEPE
ncbi:MAG TPA: ribosome-associated translation inhibitor RaiA [Gaiellaceae bacterium]|nr:ribosome-associated translation inhibitor RaiA [Gaiellaceae bacterium]